MTKRVFVSHSYDSGSHTDWVVGLATFLREQGVDVVMDVWDVEFGHDLPKFMEQHVRNSDFVLMICTDAYNRKADAGEGGVGYEKQIMTATIMAGVDRKRIIPVLRGATGNYRVPTFMGGARYLDLTDERDTEPARQDLLRVLSGKPIDKPTLGAAQGVAQALPSAGVQHPSKPVRGDSFDVRFGQAFPGLRKTSWYHGADAIARLKILLDQPQAVGGSSPIWWWRGPSNMHIDAFALLEGDVALVNVEEHRIKRIAAVPGRSYYQHFVYVEDDPMPSTGLYEQYAGSISDIVADQGYSTEEYGLLDDGRFVTRAEYDDGAAILDGQPADIRGRVDLRVRYVTSYNWLIAPNDSPINGNAETDYQIEKLLNDMLQNDQDIKPLESLVSSLPRRRNY